MLLAAGGAVLALGALDASRHLQAARDRVPLLRAALADGDLPRAQAELARVQEDASAARAATDGPLWWAAGAVPWLGRTPAAVQRVAVTVDDLTADVLTPLVTTAVDLSPERLRPEPDRLDLGLVARAAPVLGRAQDRLEPLLAGVSRQEPFVLPAVSRAQAELAGELADLRGTVRTAATATRVLPAALGADGPRRYFLAFQTNAEARGTGGLVGAYGILLADRGRLTLPVLGDDRDLYGLPPARVDHGPDYRALYGRDPELWSGANLSPHFPYAAQRWVDMWQAGTGQRLDGALATDPTALSYLLRGAGEVRLPDGERVTADRVVALTQRDAYVRFAGREDERKDYLVTLARAVSDAVLRGAGGGGELDGLRQAVAERRLLAWSTHPDEQRALAGSALAGEVPDDAAPYAAVVVTNAAGNKLDYYLQREVTYELGRCDDGARPTTVRVRLRNAVPPGPLPAYVRSRHDKGTAGTREPGSHKVTLAVYATRGAGLTRASLDGARTGVRVGTERGHPVYVLEVVLGRGQAREVALELVEPAAAGSPRVPEQPLVVPQRTVVRDAGCPGAGDVSARPVSGAGAAPSP